MSTPHTYSVPGIGKGYMLSYELAGATSYSNGNWLVSIDTDFGVGSVEWTNLASLAVRRIPTIPDNGSISGSVQYLSNEQFNLDMQSLLIAPAMAAWKITGPDTGTISFNGFLTKYSPSFENSKVNEADFEITIDGSVTFVAGT